jgi:hypothetical protein
MAEKASLKEASKGFVLNPALSALAKTDDILAIIGVIILGGVVISAYGAYWQGKVAQAQFARDFDKGKEKGKGKGALIVGSIALVGILLLLYYVMMRREKVTTIPVAN